MHPVGLHTSVQPVALHTSVHHLVELHPGGVQGGATPLLSLHTAAPKRQRAMQIAHARAVSGWTGSDDDDVDDDDDDESEDPTTVDDDDESEDPTTTTTTTTRVRT